MGHFDSLFNSKGATCNEICDSDFDSSTEFSIFKAEGTETSRGKEISVFSMLLLASYENLFLLFATIFNPFSVWIVAPDENKLK